MRLKFTICLSALFALFALRAADTPINLLRADRIDAARIHGMVTGIPGFMMNDLARSRYISQHQKYISGEDCFRLDVANGEVTIIFPDPLPAPYVEYPGEKIHFYVTLDILPPAQCFRSTGRVRFNAGNIRLSNGVDFKPGPDWQSFDHKGKFFFLLVTPAAGAKISFADLKLTPVYPEIGGEIALPRGGKLTRLLLPENADFVTRWAVAMWRGWLWKLTGVALPIETVQKVEPKDGAFAAVVDRSLKRGWQIQVNSSGITLRCSEKDDIVPALFDYLRMGLGCAFYAPDCETLPAFPVTKLSAIDRRVTPRYNAILHTYPYPTFSGAKWRPTRFVHSDPDYYHLQKPDWCHVMNIFMPMERYFGTHPEYFMMDTTGKRRISPRPSFTHPCFSNRDARNVMLKGLADYAAARNGLERICFEPGDTKQFCHCPACTAFNPVSNTNSDLLMDFSNEAAALLKSIDPEIKLFRAAYLNRCYPPVKVKAADNIHIFFCLTDDVMPCTLHADCEKNRTGMKMAADWLRVLGGDTSRLSFMTYDDARPLQFIRTAEYLNRFGSGEFYVFQWHYTPQALQFVLPRWNLGEDADKLMEEFDLHYFGKAGTAMHKITLFIDQYGRDYSHRDGESPRTSLFCGHRSCRVTVFDRAALDKIYSLFDEAIAAAGDDKVLRARIFEEKKFVLAEDFNRFGPATCGTEAELDAFIKRFVDFITMAREAPKQFAHVTPDQDMRSFLLAAVGISIPDTGKFWANEPFIDRLLADPERFFKGATRIPGGWYFKPLAMRGGEPPAVYGYQCPPRYCVALRRPSCGKNAVSLEMTLKDAPTAPSFLAIEGQDDDKPGKSRLRVTVNGQTLFSGVNSFPERSWGRMGLNIPAGFLKAGDNIIVISNITPEKASQSDGSADAAKDPRWGWIAISEVYWLDPNGDFKRFLQRDFNTQWGYHDGNSRGRAAPQIRDGKAIVDAGEMGPCYYRDHLTPKVAITRGGRVKISVTASGSGNLHIGLWGYRPYRLDEPIPQSGYGGVRTKLMPKRKSPPFKLSATPKTFTIGFAPTINTGLVMPHIYVDKGSRAEVTDFRMEILPPKSKQSTQQQGVK